MAGKSVLAAADPPDVSLFAPISRVTPQPDGTLLIHATVTNETPDSDGEILDYDSIKSVAKEFMEWPSLKEMHDPDTASGTILKLYFDDEARQVEADIHVVDPTAVKKVLAKVYRMVSIHGEAVRHKLVTVDGRAIKRRFMDFVDEISLVDRGAHPDANIARRYKPFVIAKRGVVAGPSDAVGSTEQGHEPEAAVEKAADPNVGGGRVRSNIPKENFVFPEDAPDGGFPVVEPGDIEDAVSSWGRYKGPHSFEDFKSRLTAIADRLHFTASLPQAWKETDMAKTAKAATEAADATVEPTEGEAPEEAKKPFPGARPPFKAKKAKMSKAEKKAAKAEKAAAAKVRKQAKLDARTPDQVAADAKIAEARKIAKLRRAEKRYNKEHNWLVSKKGNPALDAALEAHGAVGDAVAEETKEQAEGEDETADLAALGDADDALHEFTEGESKEIEKRTKTLRTQASHVRKYRRAAKDLRRENAKVAKYGRSISEVTAKQLRIAHDAVAKLDGSVCVAKAMETGQTSASTPVPNVGVEVGTVAKSAQGVDLEQLLREAVPAIMEPQLAAIKATLAENEAKVAEVAKSGSNGGPALYGHYDRETGTWTPLTDTGVSKAETTTGAYQAVIDTLADNDPLRRELGLAKAKAELAQERPWQRR